MGSGVHGWVGAAGVEARLAAGAAAARCPAGAAVASLVLSLVVLRQRAVVVAVAVVLALRQTAGPALDLRLVALFAACGSCFGGSAA